MTDNKIKPAHIRRGAVVYIRQSTASQVEHHRESTARQYALVQRACDLGWPKEQVVVIDEDLGISGASAGNRAGFSRLASEVALGRVGIILGLEVSRLARNNADWYRLLDLCVITDTLIGDSDGLYHLALVWRPRVAVPFTEGRLGRRHPVDGADLQVHPSGAHQSCLRRCLRVWKEPLGEICR